MKKIILLFILFLGGCSVKVLDNNINLTDIMSNNKINYYSKAGTGYKYYLPNNMKLIDSDNYNEVLYSEGYNYYLYIDVISYYFKSELNKTVNKSAYYYKELDKGYIEVNKENNKYYIKYYYNYSKIEVKVLKKDINNAINNMTYILYSIKYNSNVISSSRNNNILSFYEETFKLSKPKSKLDINYLDYSEGIQINDFLFDGIADTDKIKIISE